MPLTYTQFSSNEPPRTLYCELSSLCVETPACVATSSSTALPVVEGKRLISFVFSSCVVPIWRRTSLTTTSPICVPPCLSCTFHTSRPLGLISTFSFVSKPIMEYFTTTESSDKKFSEYSPCSVVIVPTALPSTFTLANGSPFPSSSVTRPRRCTVSAATAPTTPSSEDEPSASTVSDSKLPTSSGNKPEPLPSPVTSRLSPPLQEGSGAGTAPRLIIPVTMRQQHIKTPIRFIIYNKNARKPQILPPPPIFSFPSHFSSRFVIQCSNNSLLPS